MLYTTMAANPVVSKAPNLYSDYIKISDIYSGEPWMTPVLHWYEIAVQSSWESSCSESKEE